ncbi:hypothetical protein niasHS_007247 [Heterodera schachtii]|uniref:Uncharacterized protein n=1 Tax=Heterodera schachtii TaxID=97005 RepID=A0ABD2JJS9_HETSC
MIGLQIEKANGKICGDKKGGERFHLAKVEEMSDLIEPDKVSAFWPQLEVIGIDKALVCDRKTSDFSMEIPLLLGEGVGVEMGEKAKTNLANRTNLMEGGHVPGGHRQANKSAESPKSAPIGIDIEALNDEGKNSLNKMVSPEGEKELDGMLARMEAMAQRGGVKPLPSSVLEPILDRGNYDPRSAPAFVQGRPVEVRVGIHVQSIANFQLATMDYDMDMWLRMSWRDPRLAQNLSTPILINDELFLRRIWRPDAFFVNARDALFHRVTRLNFYAFVFPTGGEVFMEARLYLKPKSQLVLCKYPHDSQTLRLRISSIASTYGSVRFRWFSAPSNAIRVHGQLQLPDLYIDGLQSGECRSARKTGNFSCLEARFLMKRSIGYHLWQTYVPTATCVLFSWISVWLPEEFVEGRVFVALTVFLTLSAESSSAKETLPKVSYVKAIDVWFGFTAVFVFFTMLQALLVIGLEHMSGRARKTVVEQAGELSAPKAIILMMDSRRYHRMARSLDDFFKVMYPVIFVVFLIIYIFVVIEGEEQKCLQQEEKAMEGNE